EIGLGGADLAVGTQTGDLGLEVGEALETAVDTGEVEVGDLVEFPHRSEYGQPDLVGGHFGHPATADLLLDPLPQFGLGVLGDGAPLAGPPYPGDDLGTAERFGDPGALGDHEQDVLLRGESALAHGAGPAAADGRAVVRGSAVDHPGIRMAAERTMHPGSPASHTQTDNP